MNILPLQILTPHTYETYQRDGSDNADIPIAGLYSGGAGATIEASFNGGAWTDIGAAWNGASFTGTLAGQTAGQGTLAIRDAADATKTDSILYIGIGDIFVVAGQSNAEGLGTNNQVYSHATLKATLFGKDYRWHECLDPTNNWTDIVDTIAKNTYSGFGSVWPLIATSHMADQSVPCAFVPCSLGGTSIITWLPGVDHLSRSTLYGSMAYRAQLIGAMGVLWWQGEADANASMARATYNGHLDTLANAINSDLGIKILPCKLQNCSGIPDPQEALINLAIGDAWADNANVLTGPDLSGIGTDDAFHLKTDAKLLTASGLWWTTIETAYGW